MEAKGLLPELWDVVRAHGSRFDHVRVRWVEARIATGLGDRETARQALAEVRQEFLRETIVYDAALATLDLVVLDLEDGRTSDVKILAAELVAVFQAQRVDREALAALLAFHEAAALEAASVPLVRRVAAVLERSRHGGTRSESIDPR